MQCKQCGYENRDASRFCGECGASLAAEINCAACGRRSAAGQKFCDGCGARLASTPGSLAQSDPRAYTPAHLAEKILTSRSALEGERKQVTVLFADVKGSMDLAETVDPEEWHHILDRFFAILSDGVHRFEGTINQFTGDGVMALFGAPIAHEDHARRACYAALALREELARYSAELRRTRGLNFSVRMGLNSGEVIVGKIGDDLRMDYTAQGKTVGLAARMEQLAAPDRIYLTSATADLVPGYVQLEDLGLFEIKGAREPIRVHELRGVGTLRTRFDVSRARGFSRFVGREAENASLEKALSTALEGRGQMVGVVGEAGVGKSRLCFEFTERCRARGIRVHEGHAVPHGKSVPFLPVLELLRGYFGVGERDGEEETRKKVAGTLVLIDEGLRDSLPLIFDFLGVPDPSRPAPRMDPDARQRQLFATVKRLVHARSEREPAIIVFEDLHWIDGGTEAYLRMLAESIAETRTLLLVNYRPEYRAEWLARPHGRELALEPLGAEEIAEVLRDLLGNDSTLGDLADRIQRRTSGNPFFTEEVVQSLVEAGHLEGARGAYRLMHEVGDLTIPVTVQAVLAARIDRLPERHKTLLATAAVIGKELPEPVLRKVSGFAEPELRGSVAALVAGEFLVERTLFPEAIYAFKHPLTQEVAYHQQLSESRTSVHEAVARCLPELYPDQLEPKAALIAHHWESAGDALEAARWTERAARWAERTNLPEALRHWRSVRTLIEKVPRDASPDRLALALISRMNLMSLGIRLGDPENELQTLYTEARALVDHLGDRRSRGLVEAAYSGAITSLGEVEKGIAAGREAQRIAEELDDPEVRLAFTVPIVYALEVGGEIAEALEICDRALADPPDDLRQGEAIIGWSPYIQLMFFRGTFLVNFGRFDEARRELDRALELARSIGDFEVMGLVHACYAILGRCSGEAELCARHAREALEIAERIGSPLSRSFAYGSLAGAHLMAGRFAEAASAAQTAMAISHQSRTNLWTDGYRLAELAEAYLGLGDAERARATAREAVEVARSKNYKGTECHTQLALARVLLGCGGASDRAEIERALDAAEHSVVERGLEGYRPMIHMERARLSELLGDEDGRRRELGEALRLCRRIGARGYAAALESALGGGASEVAAS